MNVVIAAGGTGGHLYPAVALAREFLRRDPSTRLLFVGTARGLERRVLAHEGLPLRLIAAHPFMGVKWHRAAWALLTFPVGLLQALAILWTHRADLVLGIGGYASPPVLLAAWLMSIPRAILEPNAYPGMANRVLGPLAQRIFLAFEAASSGFARKKVRIVGTPIRHAFLERVAERADPPAQKSRSVLLLFGGSQGARAINQAMVEALPALRGLGETVTIIHQTGEADYPSVKAAYQAAGVAARIEAFLYDMPTVLRAADLVVSRSGAMTVAELAVSGKPAILVPLPTAIYGHQAKNAQVMEQAGAAVVLRQADLNGTTLANAMTTLLRDRPRLEEMGRRSRSLGRADSANVIVDDCLDLARSKG
jgi:UDP-N-acetylglucosamine--N-acetylmuramyl-(pentapeptide) pyrophosphoryl-undecaprenol N-acetylglucosamine transferase